VYHVYVCGVLGLEGARTAARHKVTTKFIFFSPTGDVETRLLSSRDKNSLQTFLQLGEMWVIILSQVDLFQLEQLENKVQLGRPHSTPKKCSNVPIRGNARKKQRKVGLGRPNSTNQIDSSASQIGTTRKKRVAKPTWDVRRRSGKLMFRRPGRKNTKSERLSEKS